MARTVVGTRVPRKEGPAKVRGEALYVDDLRRDGVLHGVTVRSSVQRGRLLGIHYEDGLPWDEITVVTAADVPGENIAVLLDRDQPLLVHTDIRHPGEPVVLLAHPDRAVVEQARARVRLEVEPAPAVDSMEEALLGDVVVWGEDNVFKTYLIQKGDLDAAWAEADLIVEGTYRTAAQEQLYLEPQGVIVEASAEAGVTVWGSMQCPYYVHKALPPVFGVSGDQVRVVQVTTGGGFGGKEEYPSLLAAHAGLLSWKAGGAPVKMVYDRAEDLAATTKRHPSRTHVRAGFKADGTMVGLDMDFVLDGGAYMTLTPVVLSRGVIHAAGPYRCANTRVRGRGVATSKPPQGAFRGFGAPQSIFALERHLDHAAERLGLDPAELRRRNLLHDGDETSTGQLLASGVAAERVLDEALARTDWAAKRAALDAAHAADDAARQAGEPGARVRRGIGLATFLHGAGFTGSGEVRLASIVDVQAHPDGRVEVLAASTEIGQGATTIFSQIAADAAGIPYEWVFVAQPDTARVPDSGPTVASRTTMVVGKLVERAASRVARRLVDAGLLPGEGWTPEEWARACGRWIEAHGPLRESAQYQPPPGVVWDEETYRGSAYAAYAWAAYVAEVAVDTVTWEARVERFTAVQDIGTVVHPELAAGQIEGGVVQALGYALTEDITWWDGAVANDRLTNYIIPTALDVPGLDVHFLEVPYEGGPSGAKGVGELPMDGPAPAVLNAISHALGVDVDEAPALPERIWEAVMAERAAADAVSGTPALGEEEGAGDA